MKSAFEIIQYLKDGGFFSYEELAQRVGGEENFKEAIAYLHILGVALDTSRLQHYRLMMPITFLNKDEIFAEIPTNQQASIDQLDVLQVVSSTNDYLWDKLSEHKPGLFSFCLSEAQTKGKGRQGKSWCSPFGQNIYLSVHHFFSNSYALSGLSLVMGLSVLKTIEHFHPIPDTLGIKWPNDLFFNNQKIGGILIETQGAVLHETMKGRHIVIGIGLNCNWSGVSFLKEARWGDLFSALGFKIDRNQFAAKLVSSLIEDLKMFEQYGFAFFYSSWSRYDLLKEKTITIQSPQTLEEGRYCGINGAGELLVMIQDKLKTITYGDVSIKI